jgi:hypothetical protein
VEFQWMSPEEIQKAIQFLLNQQAQFASDFAKLLGKTDRIADGLIGLTGLVGRVAEDADRRFKEADKRMNDLGDHIKTVDDHIKAVDDHIKTVEDHLNVVIEMFERHLREKDGPPPS